MGVYLHSRRWVEDPYSKPASSGFVCDFYIDTPDDVGGLPGREKIKEASTALILSTGQVKVLTETGWDKGL